MKFYKTYNCVAITFLVAVSGFMCVLILGSDPQSAKTEPAVSSAPAPIVNPTVIEDPQLAQADSSDIPEGIDEMMVTDSMETLGQELSEGDAPILVEADNSQDSANLASTVEVDSGSSAGAFAPNFAGISSGSGSSGTGGNSNSSGGSSSSASSGIGSSTSSAGSSAGAGSGGSGGSGTNTGRSIFPDPGTGTEDNTTDNPTDGGTVQTDTVLPEWIDNEGIRAGYLFFDSNVRCAQEMKNAGFNTVIVKGFQFSEARTENTLSAYRRWGQTCQQLGLHMFAAYNWQPEIEVLAKCRKVVFADGTDGAFPCPLDDYLWQKHLTPIATKISEGSKPYLDGHFLDMEMYGTEELPGAKRNYSSNTCYCDNCFVNYGMSRRMDAQVLSSIVKNQRKVWLVTNGELSDYLEYQEGKVEAKAAYLKSRVRLLNPTLLFGIYPHPEAGNWVRNGVARSLGRDSYPVIVFGTHSYYIGGIDSVPIDTTAYLTSLNINGTYAAGYLFRKYTSAQIESNLTQACLRDQGYWLYCMPQVFNVEPTGLDALAGGTQADYLSAIKNANLALDTRLVLE